MKRKIVITIEKKETGWTGYIQGIVNKKRTSKIEIERPVFDKEALVNALSKQIVFIEKWMEQIK